MFRFPLFSIFRNFRRHHPNPAVKSVFSSSPLRSNLSSCPWAQAPSSRFPRTASSTKFRHTSSPVFVWRTLPLRRAQLQWPQRKASRNEIYTYRKFDGHGDGGGWGRLRYIWLNYRYFIVGSGVLGSGFYVWNLEQVAMTGRVRFNCISDSWELVLGDQGYQQLMQQFQGLLLPDSHPDVRLVRQVLKRLLMSEMLEGKDRLDKNKWQVHVIKNDEIRNAFVLPGGKVFVFTGILPICEDEDGLAAVLGHEIAHVLAHHYAERLSSNVLALFGIVVGSFFFDISGNITSLAFDLLLNLPNSRTQEAEADHIGLMMMAKGCYKPEAAAEFWTRMGKVEQGAPPEILSTHPSSRKRLETIRGWLPKAESIYEDNGCGTTMRLSRDFRPTLEGFGW